MEEKINCLDVPTAAGLSERPKSRLFPLAHTLLMFKLWLKSKKSHLQIPYSVRTSKNRQTEVRGQLTGVLTKQVKSRPRLEWELQNSTGRTQQCSLPLDRRAVPGSTRGLLRVHTDQEHRQIYTWCSLQGGHRETTFSAFSKVWKVLKTGKNLTSFNYRFMGGGGSPISYSI